MKNVLVGTIRWDGWVGKKSQVSIKGAKNLSKPEYMHRLPFFAQVKEGEDIITDGATQEIMDKEIEYAKQANLDYWAFCWYPKGSNLELQRELYHASEYRNDINWCVILGTNPFSLESDLPWLIEKMKESNYQKVMGGRPLVYYFQINESQKGVVSALKKEAAGKGLKDPYVVGMGFTTKVAQDIEAAGCDAISAYACSAPTGSSYETQMEFESNRWKEYADTGKKMVPFITSGWDNRPRFREEYGIYTIGNESYVEEATPEQLTAHIQQGVDFVKENTETCEANAVIIYAWNENDEGGWLVPTLYELRDYKKPLRLEALARVKK